MNIIDFHVHPRYNFHLCDHGVNITDDIFIKDLMACGITRFCGSVITAETSYRPAEEYKTIVPQLNDAAFSLADKWKGLYVPGIHVHPACVQLSCGELERAKARGTRLVGELVPGMMGWGEYFQKNFMEIMECADYLGMVVCMHPSSPEDMKKFSEAFPTLKIVWAHLSGYGNLAHNIELLRNRENVWFDTSAYGMPVYMTLRYTIDRAGYERILFGTDYPGAGPAADIAAINFSPLSQIEKEAVLYKNAERLLGL